MGILFIDGFEKNSLDKWTAISGASGAHIHSSSGLDMSGSYAGHIDGNYQYMKKTLDASQSELYVTFRIRITGTVNKILEFRDSTGAYTAMMLRSTVTGCLIIYRGYDDGSAALDTGTKPLKLDTTYLIKVHYKPLNSGGVFDVYVDDLVTADLSFSGDSTSGLEDVQTVVFGHLYGSAASTGHYIDDVIISNTDITKNLRIAGKVVTGAGTTTEWDPSTGANYECVNEIPPSSTDYTSTNVTDEFDTFALTDCTEDINSIAAVQLELYIAKEGTPTPTHIAPAIRVGSTNYSGENLTPSTSFGTQYKIWELNPADSAAFEEADINALEVGYKATA